MTLPVAILAGGLGTRLGTMGAGRPKALIEVGGAPFIHHQLRLLCRGGVERVVILAGHLGEMIRESVGSGEAFGLAAQYSFDGPALLGTGGALVKALPLLPEKLLVLYGDSYLPIDYRAVSRAFEGSDLPALMTVWRNEDRHDRSNVVFAGGAIRVYDKKSRTPEMRHIDYGLGGLSARALAGRPEPFDLAEVYGSLAQKGLLLGLEVHERFYEVGTPSGVAELGAFLRGTAVGAGGP